MKTIWKGIRHLIALLFSTHVPEIGALLYDYKNGEMDPLMTVETPKESDQSLEMVENMLNSGRDAIYISVVKVAQRCGYFVVFDTNRGFYARGFWGGLYTPEEAYADTMRYCRKKANQMGWREPNA